MRSDRMKLDFYYLPGMYVCMCGHFKGLDIDMVVDSDIDMRVALETELEPAQVRQLMHRLTKDFRRLSRRGFFYRQVMFIPAKAS